MDLNALLKTIDDWQAWKDESVKRAKNRPFQLQTVDGFGTAILGVRRAGKSVGSLMSLASTQTPCLYLNLEDPFFASEHTPDVLEAALDVYAENRGPVPHTLFFDEIQQITHWERFARKVIDQRHHQLIITGSSAKLLSSELASTLSGRCLAQELWPLSYKEYLNFRNLTPKRNRDHTNALSDYLLWGGFPEIVLQQDPYIKQSILDRYQEDILFRDVVMRHDIRSPQQLKQLVTFLLTNISSLHSINSLKNAYDFNMVTIQNYLSYLEEAYLIFELKAYAYNLKTQVRAPRKYYCIDTGLRNTGSASPSPDWGKLAENCVYLELRRRHRELWYFSRTQEVDFIVTEKHQPKQAIQVCYDSFDTEKTRVRELSALSECLTTLSLKEGVILTKDREETVRDGKKIIRMRPLYQWLLDV